MVSSTCSAAAQSSSWVLPIVWFDLLPISCTTKIKIIVLINEMHYFYQELMLQVNGLIYIWIIINSKDQNSQASVIWKCSIKALVILDWLGSLWTPKVRSTKARGNQLKHVRAGQDVDVGGRCSGHLYLPASSLVTASKKSCSFALSMDLGIFAVCCPVGNSLTAVMHQDPCWWLFVSHLCVNYSADQNQSDFSVDRETCPTNLVL